MGSTVIEGEVPPIQGSIICICSGSSGDNDGDCICNRKKGRASEFSLRYLMGILKGDSAVGLDPPLKGKSQRDQLKMWMEGLL